jgi:hypothetical protein
MIWFLGLFSYGAELFGSMLREKDGGNGPSSKSDPSPEGGKREKETARSRNVIRWQKIRQAGLAILQNQNVESGRQEASFVPRGWLRNFPGLGWAESGVANNNKGDLE